VAELKYLGRTARNQNYIDEEIGNRLNMGNACNHSVLPVHLASISVRICKGKRPLGSPCVDGTIILEWVLEI